MTAANRLVVVPSIASPIVKSPGFAKKMLSTYKLDLMALCGFGCRYCSSNTGNYLRINRERFADLTQEQLGERLLPANSPELAMIWPDVMAKLDAQIQRHGKAWGVGETLVVSMLTDAFSGPPLHDGTTEAALRMVLAGTSFRVRILSKNSTVGTSKWLDLFRGHPDRFVVGLSTGTLDAAWARRVEIGTPPPQARIAATRALQAASIPTFGMLCPVFPDVLHGDQLERLVDAINPSACEHVWAEPFNDRANWQVVRSGYEEGSPGWTAMTRMFGGGGGDAWSSYATDLFLRLRDKARREGWMGKLRFLQYENDITDSDAARVDDLEGLLLQSKPDAHGLSQHPVFARMQQASAERRGPERALTNVPETPPPALPPPGAPDEADPVARSSAARKAWATRRQREASDIGCATAARVVPSAAAEKAWATRRGKVLTSTELAAINARASSRVLIRIGAEASQAQVTTPGEGGDVTGRSNLSATG